MKDIAVRAGVSVATVGRVLQGTGKNVVRVGEDTSKRIREIAITLNYKPNLAAQQLRGKTSRTIGVLMAPDAIESNFIRLTEIEARANEKNYRLMVGYEHFDPNQISDYVDDFSSRGIEGIICMHHAFPQAKELIPKIIMSKFQNIVFIDKPKVDNANYVGIDFVKCGRDVVNYLLKKGKRNIGLVVTDLKWVTGPNLREGYITELEENGFEPDPLKIIVGEQIGYTNNMRMPPEIADKIIDELVVRQKVDAIMGATDLWAAQILNRLVHRGYKVPQDVAVVGHGNLYISDYVVPRMTSVDLKFKEVAYNAVDLLLELMNSSDKKNKTRTINAQIVERQSS